MITAEQAKIKAEQVKIKAREMYLKMYDQLYTNARNKLENAIAVAIGYGLNKAHIILQDIEIAENLEKECKQNGYTVKYDLKEREYSVEW